MIYLHTGQPGAGKTLYTLTVVRERAIKEKRPVFYSGIADCRMPEWIELPDATEWASVPHGAIIVIDEAQRIFRPRHAGSQVPTYVAALETHRHQGLDIYVITQHPTLVEANVRRLVGSHRHVMRAFGAKAAIVHEWNEVRTDCDTKRDGSISSTFKYPAEVFALYKSAEVHTHKARIPLRVWLVLGSPLILGAIGWSIWTWVSGRMDSAKAAERVATIAGQPANARSASPGSSSKDGKNPTDWLIERTPRVAALAHTAPVYDGITKPVRAPFPAMCLQTAKRCQCYSQQGTRMDVGPEVCAQLVERGFFKDWQDGDDKTLARSPGRDADKVELIEAPSGAVAPYVEADPANLPIAKPQPFVRRVASAGHVGRSPAQPGRAVGPREPMSGVSMHN